MTSDGDPSDSGPGRGPTLRRVLTGLTAGLVLVAVVLVVVSDDARWLRLAVVAALWAALVGLAALVRRPGTTEAGDRDGSGDRADGPDAGTDLDALRRTYELELADEVAARREYELTLEQNLRRELESERSGEIAALRAEVERMRTVLEQRGTNGEAAARARLQVVGGSPVPAPTAPAGPGPAPTAAASYAAGPEGRGAGPSGGRPSAAGTGRGVPTGRPVGGPSDPRAVGPADPRAGDRRPGPPAGRPSGTVGDWAGSTVTGEGASGRTVAELLAAHAGQNAPSRRRRRDG